jgi:hypothetical protein
MFRICSVYVLKLGIGEAEFFPAGYETYMIDAMTVL